MDEVPNGGTLTTAPPPPPEVKIRTMQSDIASMAANGGGAPQFTNIKVAGLSAEQASPTVAARTESKSNLLLIVVLIIAVIALGIIGWLVYTKFG